MTKKNYIFIPALIAVLAVALAVPTHVTHASSIWETVIGGTFNLVGWVLTPLAYLTLSFMSLMTYLSGILLNEVVYHTIINMAQNFNEISTIDSTWATLRDLANMGFIFVLLYAAIQQILGTGKNLQRLIVNMVVAALLVNFSLFFTKLIIDASNILALLFYNAMAPGVNTGSAFDTGISNVFVNILGLQTLFNWKAVLTATNIVTIGVMGSITLAVVSFVFASIALMLIIRYVVLIFLMILSPIAFVAGVIPNVGDLTKNWWGSLMGQAFFAPVFMMLAWIAASITSGVGAALKVQNYNWTDALRGTVDANGTAHAGVINLVILFLIVITFLMSALITAKQFSNRAGGVVKKMNDWATGTAGTLTLGMEGKFVRGTTGRAAQAIADSEWMKDKASSSLLGRLGMAAAQKTAGASFDLRGSIAGSGKAQKGGFTKDLENKVKAQKKYADSFKPSDLVVDKAEADLKKAKETGTAAEIAAAQKRVDDLKGVTEDDARKRTRQLLQEQFFEANDRTAVMSDKRANAEIGRMESIRESRIKNAQRQDPNLTRKAAEDQWKAEYDAEVNRLVSQGTNKETAELEASKTLGWKANTVKGVANERKTTYEKGNTEGMATLGGFKVPGTNYTVPQKKMRFSFSDRIFMVGPVKKERFAESLAIRKDMKSKSKEKKIMEAVEEAAADGGGAEEAAANPPADAGGGGGTPPTT